MSLRKPYNTTNIYLSFLTLSIMGVVAFYSCRKEYSCEDCLYKNKPPIALAGPDQVITLPTDSVLFDGSKSNDPDGSISGYLWSKISGPLSFNIIKPGDSATKVKAFVEGTYQFELKVTDNEGLSATDTVQVTVNSAAPINRPPIANAGSDQTINLPANTFLDGRGSTDPDNNITNYVWTKISGPSSFTITNTNVVQTQVTNLVQGIYQFELKVTDAGGLFSRDTMELKVIFQPPPPTIACDPLTRPIINAQLISIGTLSEEHIDGAVASAGGKILIAGGNTGMASSSRVDIYDLNNNSWSTAELSKSRYLLSAISAGNTIFFAGGGHNDASGLHFVTTVDIYDVSSGNWSTAHLSEARQGIVTAALGNKVFFAGGFNDVTNTYSNTVDIYDLTNNSWSTAQLSQGRAALTATTVGNKVYFAGGNNADSALKTVDIFDGQSGTWSVSAMSIARSYHGAILIQNKIYWAGGYQGLGRLCNVEIKDVNTQISLFANLFQSNSNLGVFQKNNQIAFFPGRAAYNQNYNYFDVYDISSNVWQIALLPLNIRSAASVISVNNIIYVFGGAVNNVPSKEVWQLQF